MNIPAPTPPRSSIESDKFKVEHQVRVLRHEAREAPVGVRLRGWDGDLRPLPYGELRDALVEAGDHLLGTQLELERLVAVARLGGGRGGRGGG